MLMANGIEGFCGASFSSLSYNEGSYFPQHIFMLINPPFLYFAA